MIRSPEDLDFLEYIGSEPGSHATAGGAYCEALGAGSFAWGNRSRALARGSIAIGDDLTATEVGQVEIAEMSGAVHLKRIGDRLPRHPVVRPPCLCFLDEENCYMTCDVMFGVTKKHKDRPGGGRAAAVVSAEEWIVVWPELRLECWCGWEESGSFSPPLAGQALYHERKHENAGDGRYRAGPGYGRRIEQLTKDRLYQVERLFRAHRSAARPLPMVEDVEDAGRLLVWCDRILPSVALRHVWWIEQWSKQANQILGRRP